MIKNILEVMFRLALQEAGPDMYVECLIKTVQLRDKIKLGSYENDNIHVCCLPMFPLSEVLIIKYFINNHHNIISSICSPNSS